MDIKLEKEASETLPPGYARIFHVIYFSKEDGSIEYIFTYPTMSVVEKHFRGNKKFEEKYGYKFDREFVKVFPGAVYYAGDNDHNEMVKF